MSTVGPVQASERISTLDTLRGFALLGILLMNIVGFGLPSAYDDPTNSGGATGINLWTWIVLHVLAEGKMRCLFSMIFGAGIVLLTGRNEARGGSAADVYYRRNLWLMALGAPHAYLLWGGEILYPYGLAALALYPFRRMEPRKLIAIGGAMLVIIIGCNIQWAQKTQKAIAEGKAAIQMEVSGAKLSEEQLEAKKKWEAIRSDYKPTQAEIDKKTKAFRGTFWQAVEERSKGVYAFHALPYYHYWNLDVFSMMFLGMAFFRLGIFSGERSLSFYAGMAALGYLIGLPLNSYSAQQLVATNFDIATRFQSNLTYDIGRLSVAMGHVGLLLLLLKAGLMGWLMRPLAAVGQMALSNYLTHSVVCATIFCGFGFGMYGRLERHQLYYVVFGLWIFQLIMSPIWLRHFQFGPAEWVWRSLTYWQKQPMRKIVGQPETLPAEVLA